MSALATAATPLPHITNGKPLEQSETRSTAAGVNAAARQYLAELAEVDATLARVPNTSRQPAHRTDRWYQFQCDGITAGVEELMKRCDDRTPKAFTDALSEARLAAAQRTPEGYRTAAGIIADLTNHYARR